MGNIVDVQVTDEKVILKIPQKSIVHEVDNVAAFDSKSKKLLFVGISQKAYQELEPKKWKKLKDKMEFLPIFVINKFSPEAAAMLLSDWWSQTSRHVVPQYTIFKHQAKLELNIVFENYESIHQEQREEFEHLVFRFLFAKKLIVNGKEKHWGQRDWLPGSLYLGITYIVGMVFLISSAIPMSIGATLISSVNLSPLLSLLFYALLLLGSILAAIYLGRFIGFIFWLLILKPFFGRKIILTALSYSGSEPRKYRIGKIEKLLINWIFAERDPI